MNTKFVRIDAKLEQPGKQDYSFTEWFCLSETWTHPYNRDNAFGEAFRKWCSEHRAEQDSRWNGCCPDIRISDNVLCDGWGSDIAARHVGIVGSDGEEESWGVAMDRAIGGNVATVRIEGPRGVYKAVMTPVGDVEPDDESLAEFGPFADQVEAEFSGKDWRMTALKRNPRTATA